MHTPNPAEDYANRNCKMMDMPPRPGQPRPSPLAWKESQTKGHVDSKTPSCIKGSDPETRPLEPNSGWSDPNYC